MNEGFFEPQTGYFDGEHGFGGPGTPGFPVYGAIWVDSVVVHPETGVKYAFGFIKDSYDGPWKDDICMFTEEIWADNFWWASETIVREGKWKP